MDLGGDLGAVVRATKLGCSHGRIDGPKFNSRNLLNGSVVEPIKEVPISNFISISNTITYAPNFYDCNPSRSQALPLSMFESLDHYYHQVVQKVAWPYGTADSSLSAEVKAEKKDQVHDLIMHTTSTTTTSNQEEQASKRIGSGVVCPSHVASSSPPRAVHVKSPPRSATRQDDPSAKTPEREAGCSPSSPIKTESAAEIKDTNKTTASGRRTKHHRTTVRIPATEGSWNKPGGGGGSSDIWAWRKYGQKPIKGSPYPRSYYRCSSCKGCPARKQVERSHTDPTMFVITYTAEHNHAWPTSNPRNGLALAGSSHKDTMALVVPPSPQKSDAPAAKGSNPASPTMDTIEQEKPRSQLGTNCLDFNLLQETTDCVVEDHDQTTALHMVRSNHMHYDDPFADLGELKDLAKYFADYKSDEETGCTIVDPYNLFNWSPSFNNKTPVDP